MKLKKTLLAISLATLSLDTFAAAFQLAEHSASGLGRAFAGEAAIAENASVIARNPALMSQFSRSQFSLSATYVKPDVSLQGQSAPAYSNVSAMNDDSIADHAIIPAAYFVLPIDKKWAFGLGVFSNFGLSTEFEPNYAAGQLAGKSDITTMNLNAALSYKVNQQFTIAAGISYISADAQIIRHFGDISNALAANGITIPASTESINLEGDDNGYGWNVGIAYDVAPGHRLGLHYRAATDIDFTGKISNQLPYIPGLFDNGLNGKEYAASLELELPATLEFSGTHQLSEQAGLHYSILWTDWSSFQALQAYSSELESQFDDGQVFSKEEGFKDAMRYAIGADYKLNQNIKLRAGIAYDKTPSKQHLSISIPDTNRLWFTTGANYALSEDSSIDVGIAYLKGDKQTFSEADNSGGVWKFKSEGNAWLVSAQYNRTF
ncbi:outer membrane protein transport protein [Neptunicella sp.]|uniref:outer membrane protein transport protein n=1 Tax=Neptunicella sp. TaxID=2125986 RepID=UPI003F692DF3